MDYQYDILNMLPEKCRAEILQRAEHILQVAREAGYSVMYVTVSFRNGYPEIHSRNKIFSKIRESGMLLENTRGSEIHEKIAPQQNDTNIVKRRISAFFSTDLHPILNSKGITSLIVFGVVTSGVVLSTLRSAADRDYSLVVVSDACADLDEEVHRVLMKKVFPRQATIVKTEDLIMAIKADI